MTRRSSDVIPSTRGRVSVMVDIWRSPVRGCAGPDGALAAPRHLHAAMQNEPSLRHWSYVQSGKLSYCLDSTRRFLEVAGCRRRASYFVVHLMLHRVS